MRQLTLLTSIFLLFIQMSANAQIKYVSDQLSINMRSDKGVQFKITKILKSGTPVEVLQKDSSGYTKVKAPNGHIGWVLTRFLQNNKVARELNTQALAEIDKLKKLNTTLNDKFNKISEDYKTLLNDKNKLEALSQNQSAEIIKLKKIAARPMQLERNNEQLRKDILSNEAKTRILKQELLSLKEDNDKDWFIAGALVLFGGIILGLILPKMRSRQRSQSWSRLS